MDPRALKACQAATVSPGSEPCSKCSTSSAATIICAPVSPMMMMSPTLLRSIPVPRIDPKKSLHADHLRARIHGAILRTRASRGADASDALEQG